MPDIDILAGLVDDLDRLLDELTVDLTAIRGRGETVARYFALGSSRRTAASAVPTRARIALDRIAAYRASIPTPTPEPPTPPPPPPPPPPPAPTPPTPIERSRPYSADSPWNTPIGANPTILAAPLLPGTLTSDPSQYTYPVFYVENSTPFKPVKTAGWYSFVYDEGRKLDNRRAGIAFVPIPPNVVAAAGSDGQVIIINRDTGHEYGFWQFRQAADGSWSASNGYRYNVGWSAVPPPPDGGGFGFVSRGAGVPYLTGLIRPWEIQAGVIEHALALAFMAPSAGFVYPATKSDGSGADGIPEGARFQLDPAFDVAFLANPVARIVARALQVYGAYVIDVSGSTKVMFEYEATAKWGGGVTRSSVSAIPLSRMRRVSGGPGA